MVDAIASIRKHPKKGGSMLQVQVEYYKLQETKQHNRAMEKQAQAELFELSRHHGQEEATNWFNAYEQQRTHKVNEAIQQSQADSSRIQALAHSRSAEASMISALANQTNAETNQRNAEINQQNANSNRMQAQAALQNANTNAENLKVNQVNAMVGAGSTAVNTFIGLAGTPGKVRGQALSNRYGAARTKVVENRVKGGLIK